MITHPDHRIGEHQHAGPGHEGHSHQGHEGHGHAESYAHVQGGPTVLDIGGDIGAMVATMPAAAEGTELHLRSEHHPPLAIHTGVWRRQDGDRVIISAVFAELPEGGYWVLDDSGRDVRRVVINGGVLTAVDLRR